MTYNTYNGEWGTLSQDLQLTAFGGAHAEYAAVQVHGGCDIRGGYTAPRVYRNEYGMWIPMEREYHCPSCNWFDAESVIGYDHPELVWVPSPVDWPDLVDWVCGGCRRRRVLLAVCVRPRARVRRVLRRGDR